MDGGKVVEAGAGQGVVEQVARGGGTTGQVECDGAFICPGFLDVQINGAFGLDFTSSITDQTTAEQVLGCRCAPPPTRWWGGWRRDFWPRG